MSQKPKLTVVSDDPVIIHINKNGRPVRQETAELYVKKKFPQVLEWKFIKTDHSILATQLNGTEK